MIYQKLIKPFFFLFDAERAHYLLADLLTFTMKIPGISSLFRAIYGYEHPSLRRTVFGIEFPNPVGLAAGFDIADIYFSGFYSQGDGAMFEYETINDTLLNKFVDGLDLSPMRKSWLRSQTYARGRGKHSGHYYHENCCSHVINFEPNFGWNENFSNWINSFGDQYEEFVIAEYKTLCGELYSRLSKYNDELTSDQEVADTIIMNEWEFDVDGNNFH